MLFLMIIQKFNMLLRICFFGLFGGWFLFVDGIMIIIMIVWFDIMFGQMVDKKFLLWVFFKNDMNYLYIIIFFLKFILKKGYLLLLYNKYGNIYLEILKQNVVFM